jgi:dTDP-4-amino-4,6-dideoxygalactose transaminase
MTEVCAAMGLTNLDAVHSIVQVNKGNYEAYGRIVGTLPFLDLVQYDGNGENNYQYVVLLVSEDCPVSRDGLLDALHRENVLARKYFWPGCHRMQPYRDLFPDAGAALPETEAIEERILVMPTGTSVNPEMIATIGQILRRELGEV